MTRYQIWVNDRFVAVRNSEDTAQRAARPYVKTCTVKIVVVFR